MKLKATKEGPRKILIIAPRLSHICIRDATTGLLLRVIGIPFKITIYSLVIDGGILHCGNNRSEIISIDFSVSSLIF